MVGMAFGSRELINKDVRLCIILIHLNCMIKRHKCACVITISPPTVIASIISLMFVDRTSTGLLGEACPHSPRIYICNVCVNSSVLPITFM